MRYATVLTVVSNSQDIEIMKNSAVPFVQAHGSHLEVICIGVDSTQTGYYFAGANALVHDEGRKQAMAHAQGLYDEATKALKKTGILFDVQPVVVQPGSLSVLVAERSQFADLVILPPPYAPGRATHAPTVTEAALFAGQAPVLICDSEFTQPDRIVLAWNQSRESLRAARQAIPLIANAKRTDVLIVDPPRHNVTHGDPGTNISKMLGRHGGNPSVVIEVQTLPRVSDTIKRHAEDAKAGLLVMGAYGHSRLREAILGGATRRMLEEATLPILLAH